MLLAKQSQHGSTFLLSPVANPEIFKAYYNREKTYIKSSSDFSETYKC